VLSQTAEIILRLGAALIIGSAIGVNRDLHGKAAGLRTHALVSLGAAAATLIPHMLPRGFAPIDPNATGRILQGILTGVGFLGAGVILRDPNGHVTGLTTAAAIWMCAVLGIACGLGLWSLLAIALGMTGIALIFGASVERMSERWFRRRKRGPTDPSL
jgi:putative Mg2+ transporter-C (MgtC) family protein